MDVGSGAAAADRDVEISVPSYLPWMVSLVMLLECLLQQEEDAVAVKDQRGLLLAVDGLNESASWRLHKTNHPRHQLPPRLA